jgi:hypothetical protein
LVDLFSFLSSHSVGRSFIHSFNHFAVIVIDRKHVMIITIFGMHSRTRFVETQRSHFLGPITIDYDDDSQEIILFIVLRYDAFVFVASNRFEW